MLALGHCAGYNVCFHARKQAVIRFRNARNLARCGIAHAVRHDQLPALLNRDWLLESPASKVCMLTEARLAPAKMTPCSICS